MSGTVRADDADIYKVKAAFLFNLAGFITWPESAFSSSSDPLRFCIVGNTPTADYLLAATRRERVGGRHISLEFPEQSGELSRCHLLLLAEDAVADYDRIIRTLSGFPVLTLSSRTGFSSRGGMLTLSKRGNRLHPVVNISALNDTGIRISSRVLRLATIVGRDGEGR